MFFGNDAKLKKEIAEKNEKITLLELEIKQIKSKANKELKSKNREITELNKEIERLNNQLKDLSMKLEEVVDVDSDSGAHNQRYFYDVSESMISLAKRHKSDLSLAVVLIDQFESINNESQQANDILQTIVHKIDDNIRESDIFVRLHGAKFVILFPDTSLTQAEIVSEKLRKEIGTYCIYDSLKFTISVGISQYDMSSDNINSVLERANKLLSSDENSKGNIVIT